MQTSTNATASSTFCTKHCDAARSFLPNVKQYIERNVTCNTELREEIHQNELKIREMHQLFQSIYDQLQQSNERKTNRIAENTTTLNELLQAIELNANQSIAAHDQFAGDAQRSHTDQTNLLATWNKDVLDIAQHAEECVGRLMSENAKQQAALDEQVANTMQELERQHHSTAERIRVLQSEIAQLDTTAAAAFRVDTEHILVDLQTAANRQDDWNSLCVSLNNAMARDISEYGESVTSHVLECRERLEEFHRKDMQTYRSTGDTPAKREFKYPKQLVQTSPHDRLVRKFWTNFDGTLTELDCSVAICEGNESTFLDGITDDKSSSILLAPNHQRGGVPHPDILVSPSVDTLPAKALQSSAASNARNSDAEKTLKPRGVRPGSSMPTSPVSRSRSSSPSGRKLSTSARDKENVY